MALTPTLVTGDDSVLPVELLKNKITFTINGAATVKASVVSKDRKTIILAPVVVLEAEAGSDWVNSLVVAKFDSADTGVITAAAIKTSSALLEVQVDDGGKLTWFIPIKILQGTIDQ